MKNENIFGISKCRIVNLERISPRLRIEEKARIESKFRRAGNWSTKFTTRRPSEETHTRGDERSGKRRMKSRDTCRKRKKDGRRGSKHLCKAEKEMRKWKKKARKETYDENIRSLSPFLSSPRLAGCIYHWVALARDTRGGHVGRRRRVATPTMPGVVEVRQESYDKVGG